MLEGQKGFIGEEMRGLKKQSRLFGQERFMVGRYEYELRRVRVGRENSKGQQMGKKTPTSSKP